MWIGENGYLLKNDIMRKKKADDKENQMKKERKIK